MADYDARPYALHTDTGATIWAARTPPSSRPVRRGDRVRVWNHYDVAMEVVEVKADGSCTVICDPQGARAWREHCAREAQRSARTVADLNAELAASIG